ncbi:MAG: ABC transporter ATP-binding protein [Geminicoccaceae bacterium]|nr:ABC transporter ATP-binding protein [Geminicoccaceae bacterium]MCS7267554.1 ABC transporter ATP-binding protein [Geminicoccaceae bacterium]MCX7630251.1 ABC transporter ATP-binding protein [Geminicoccaceae bacterium]MDW8124568.1 ABC transporter ATP-binding protein [Geminicoccaceae bacterium]MDW8341078.1 ABC transporter ATP-binding protein [Geminicoccaceae bacterium]
MLEIRGLAKRYENGLRALEGVDLVVPSGRFVTVIGPSGCGKSTLLRLLAGLERPSAGTVRLGGEDLRGPSPNIGVVFQEPRLMPWLDLLRNVAFGLSRRIARRERAAMAARAIARVGLAGFERALPKELSGGMAQRAALARALVTRPRLLLLDEPFSALDALLRARLREELLRIWAEDRPTVVLVTHDLDEAVLLADTVVVLGGRPGSVRAVVENDAPRPRAVHEPGVRMLRGRLLALLGSCERAAT